MVTIITQTCLSVMLHIQCVSCCNYSQGTGIKIQRSGNNMTKSSEFMMLTCMAHLYCWTLVPSASLTIWIPAACTRLFNPSVAVATGAPVLLCCCFSASVVAVVATATAVVVFFFGGLSSLTYTYLLEKRKLLQLSKGKNVQQNIMLYITHTKCIMNIKNHNTVQLNPSETKHL